MVYCLHVVVDDDDVVVLLKKIDDVVCSSLLPPLSSSLSLSLSLPTLLTYRYVLMMKKRVLLFTFGISTVNVIFHRPVVSFVSRLLTFSVRRLLLRGRLLRRRRGNRRKLLRVPVEKPKPRVMSEPVPSSVIWNVRIGQHFRLLWLVHATSKALRLARVHVPAPVRTQPISGSRSVSMMVVVHTIVRIIITTTVVMMTRLPVAILSPTSSDVVVAPEPVAPESARPAVRGRFPAVLSVIIPARSTRSLFFAVAKSPSVGTVALL